MLNILLFIHLVIALLLVTVILLQKTSTDGLSGIGGGNNMGLVSGRSAATFLTNTTIILAVLFFVNALALANLSITKSPEIEPHHKRKSEKVKEDSSVPIAR